MPARFLTLPLVPFSVPCSEMEETVAFSPKLLLGCRLRRESKMWPRLLLRLWEVARLPLGVDRLSPPAESTLGKPTLLSLPTSERRESNWPEGAVSPRGGHPLLVLGVAGTESR